jgi:MGT family glycosyltransferase
MGLLPSNSLLGKVRDRLLARVFYQVLKQYLKPLNEVRAKFALAPWSSLVDVYHQADLRLIQTCEAFDAPIIPSPKNVRYVGPVLEDPGWSESYACRPLKKDGRPLVVVSLSTTFQNQKPVLQKIISAFAHLEVDCLVTLGPAMMNETFDAPENVHIMEGAPHNQLFPLADAVVTHAGHGTVMRALAHGLPIVCLPMGRDQNDNAALVAHHGAGIRLSRKTGAVKIAQAIEQVLHDPQFKNAALSLQEKIQKDVSENRAVQHLEALAGTLKT